jgi:hypothetical protein
MRRNCEVSRVAVGGDLDVREKMQVKSGHTRPFPYAEFYLFIPPKKSNVA